MHLVTPTFFQLPFFDSPVEFLGYVTLLLVVLTLLLFVTSVVARIRHWSSDQLVKAYRNKHYPLIFDYLEGERTEGEIMNEFLGEGIEFSVFENIIFEMLESVEGEEVEKLQQLLLLPPIFNHHLGQLTSNDHIQCIKACNYYRYIQLVNDKVIQRLNSLLNSENKLTIFSAASALMASREVSIREGALRHIASTGGYSRMALLEMVYNFQNNDENQMEEEAGVLKELVENKKVPPRNAAVIIEGASEMGYQQLLSFFFEKLKSTGKRWRHPEVFKALIKAQGTYYNTEALPRVLEHVGSHDTGIRATTAFTLGRFGDETSLQILSDLLHDPVYEVKYVAVKSLYENGEAGKALLRNSYEKEHLNIRSIVNTL